MSSANNDRRYVVTYAEVAGIFIIFALLLFLLNPKEMLREQVLSEESNYDLTAFYLKHMLQIEPENEQLMLAMAKVSAESGKNDLARKILEILRLSQNDAIRQEVYPIDYAVHKQLYYSLEEGEARQKVLRTMGRLVHTIVMQKLYPPAEQAKWYQEAILTDQPRAALTTLAYLLNAQITPKRLENAYYLARRLNETAEAERYLHLLLEHDTAHKVRWLEALYHHHMQTRAYDKAYAILEANQHRSAHWSRLLAAYYLQRRFYIEASLVFEQLMENAPASRQKRGYLQKALDALQAGEHHKSAVALAQRYEADYLGDKAMTKRFMQLYLQSDRLDLASALAKKLLEAEHQ